MYATPPSNRVASREILVKSTKDQPGSEHRPTWKLNTDRDLIKMALICLTVKDYMTVYVSL